MTARSATRTSLLFVSSHGLADRAIRSWDGDRSSHVGVRVGNTVIDATLRHGVARWDLDAWLGRYQLIDDLPVFASSGNAEATAIQDLVDRIGEGYDILEALGFLALRDLGSPGKPICSRLAIDYITDATGLQIPGKQGRIAPRIVRTALHSFNAGRAAAFSLPQTAT